ncbi:hypothetical protein [Streptomyces sp. NEAU-YJ-81]|uniref:hypothetical protein n=1 Tax=Streptomyces sp. NEAU-YJ-81 TaxID=2820288 RepID=UPI001ABD27BB|nr:hypothetical protein [Streptomyces sp. NEAU-YJ-81]MBO3676689.1 hypothetical protein [Streptomyces sp. NEAU-YJ-81]
MNHQLHQSQPNRPVPAPGQMAYDPVSDRTGVVQAVHSAAELRFDHRMTGDRVAFLRPERGGIEWTADAAALRFPADGERMEKGPCDAVESAEALAERLGVPQEQ